MPVETFIQASERSRLPTRRAARSART